MTQSSLSYRQIILPNKRPLVIVVVSDTHTTITNPEFNPVLIDRLQNDSPDVIFHLGDLAYPDSLNDLMQFAPCYFVRGNRDLRNSHDAPFVITCDIGQWKFLITHGHGTTSHYILDKFKYGLYGYDFTRYRSLVESLDPHANVYLFGHTHKIENRWIDGRLFFNPGAACMPNNHDPHPSFGKIKIDESGRLSSEIIYLDHKTTPR